MKKYIRVILLIVFTLSIGTSILAQSGASITPEQLRILIQSERERYIQTMADMTETLHELFRESPEAAQQAVEQYSKLLDDQLKLAPEYRPFSAQEVADMKAQLLATLIRFERERYIDTIIEISEALPLLHQQDPAQAARAVELYSALLDDQLSFSPEYRPFSPSEVAYLKGHLRAYQQDSANLYSYYQSLIEESRITADQPSMYYLLYLLQMQDPDKADPQTAANLLQSLLNNAGNEKCQLLYGFLWVDQTAAMGDSGTASELMSSFQRTRDLVSGQIVPRKAAIAERIQALANDAFFQAPSVERAATLLDTTQQIRTDLSNLYDELIPLEGLVSMEEITALKERELALIDSFHEVISSYYDSEFWFNERILSVRDILVSLKESQEYFGELVERIDGVFARTEESYGDEYAYYMDVEAKILLDLIGAATIYAHAAELIDIEIAGSPDWDASQVMNARGRRALYLNESVRLMDEFDQRYTQFTTDNPWKSHYDTVLDNYVSALRQQISIESGVIEAEFALEALERRRVTSVGIPQMIDIEAGPITELASIYDAHYSFITLQRDFRLLQYREKRRLENIDSMSYEENVAIMNAINQAKEDYITRAQQFAERHPDFKGFAQPTGEYLVSIADVYYNMAEFQYSLDPVNPDQALAYYKLARSSDPQFAMMDRVNYNIGFLEMGLATRNKSNERESYYAANPNAVTYSEDLRFSEADFAEAISSLRAVTEGSGEQRFKDESRLHLATMYFLLASDSTSPQSNVNLALSYLNPLVEDENNPLHFEALYQRGVVHMNFGGDTGYRNAIDDYARLLMGIKSGVVTDPELIKDYQDAAVDNIAFALIALDGSDFESTAQGAQLEEFLINYDDETVIARIYDKAAAQKQADLGSPLQARDFLMAKVRRLPRSLENPSDINQTVLLYNQHYTELSPERQRTATHPLTYRFNQYQYLIDRYDKSSSWYETNKDNPGIIPQLAVIDSAYVAVEARLINNFANAINNPDMDQEARQAAYSAYEDLILKWSEFEELHVDKLQERIPAWEDNIINFSATLAESSDSPQDWYQAYNNLVARNDRNPEGASFQYEGLAFNFAQDFYNDQSARFEQPDYSPDQGLPQTKEELYDFYDQAALRFISSALNPDNLTQESQDLAFQTMLVLGDMNAERGRNEAAMVYYMRLLNVQENTDDLMKRDLCIKLADIEAERGNYEEAEDWYRQALVLATDAQDEELIQNQILVQIQNQFEAAEADSDYETAAQEYLRMAAEYKDSNPQRYLGFQNEAKDAFIKAGRYQSAIDILMQLAAERTEKDEVYALHFQAWGIADSLMNDEAQSQRIKDGFIAKYPNSNEAYTLSLLEIEKLKNSPATRMDAADRYLALYERVKAGTIDAGDDKPEDIYLWAINIYIQDNLVEQRNALFRSFIDTYPANDNSMVFLQSLADYHWAQGDTLIYEDYARQIYERDPNESARLQNIANVKLGKIAFDFDAAYINEDWEKAFAKRDEFIALENEYKSMGLSFQSESAYQSFAQAQEDYDRIQARKAFYAGYDRSLDNLEDNGFVSKTPGALITVNPNTTWTNHLIGGNYNRFGNLQSAVTAEIGRIVDVLSSATEFDLDNARRLRAINLMARVNEHAKYAIDTQVEQYFAITNDFRRNTAGMSTEQLDELKATLRAYVAQNFTYTYLNAAYSYYLQTYNTYYLAGYRDQYTARAQEMLQEWNAEPNYRIDKYPLASEWTISYSGGANRSGNIGAVSTPNGINLGQISIPAGTEATISRTINTRVQPEFGFVQMIYPYDAGIKINGREVLATYIPADTLTAGDATTTRFALLIEGTNWAEGENSIELSFPNDASEAMPLMLSLHLALDNNKLATAVPTETVVLSTGTDWNAIAINEETSEEQTLAPVPATAFGIDKQYVLDLESSSAQPIWVPETEEARVNKLIFEYSFDISTVFREGYIDFVAPRVATVLLNGVEISMAEELYYEATEPPVYYPNRVFIDGQHIVAGRNVLRFVVENDTDFRGFMADITIKKTIQE